MSKDKEYDFWYRKDNSLFPEYVYFDSPFNRNPDKTQKELFEKLEIIL